MWDTGHLLPWLQASWLLSGPWRQPQAMAVQAVPSWAWPPHPQLATPAPMLPWTGWTRSTPLEQLLLLPAQTEPSLQNFLALQEEVQVRGLAAVLPQRRPLSLAVARAVVEKAPSGKGREWGAKDEGPSRPLRPTRCRGQC